MRENPDSPPPSDTDQRSGKWRESRGLYWLKMPDYADENRLGNTRALPWHFIDRHRDDFASNPRMGMMYRNWVRQKPERREALLQRADDLLARLEQL